LLFLSMKHGGSMMNVQRNRDIGYSALHDTGRNVTTEGGPDGGGGGQHAQQESVNAVSVCDCMTRAVQQKRSQFILPLIALRREACVPLILVYLSPGAEIPLHSVCVQIHLSCNGELRSRESKLSEAGPIHPSLEGIRFIITPLCVEMTGEWESTEARDGLDWNTPAGTEDISQPLNSISSLTTASVSPHIIAAAQESRVGGLEKKEGFAAYGKALYCVSGAEDVWMKPDVVASSSGLTVKEAILPIVVKPFVTSALKVAIELNTLIIFVICPGTRGLMHQSTDTDESIYCQVFTYIVVFSGKSCESLSSFHG
ncbi:hypothetical protein KUDE01_031142, partial [Dissostichus eleginoides]